MKTIGVLGANSQVGSEVSLFLAGMTGVRVIGICRTPLSSSFIRRCGVECRHGRVDVPDEAPALLRGLDVVADFTLPRGTPSAVRATSTRLIESAMGAAAPDAKYVYISSINAFGMPKGVNVTLRPYLFCHTVYGASKRHAERLAMRIGRESNRQVFALRLGQVHGELQGVSDHLRRAASKGYDVVVPDRASYSVFAFSVAEAIANIARGREDPGLYTLVSTPRWNYRELYEHYATLAERPVDIAVEERPVPMSISARLAKSVGQTLLRPLARFSLRHGELIAGNLTVHLPRVEARLLGAYIRETKTKALTEGALDRRARPFSEVWPGEIPGPFLRSLSDSRITMPPAVAELRARIARASET